MAGCQPPTPEYEVSGNAFLNRLFGAHLHDVPWTGDRNSAIKELGDRVRAQGRRPYFVPYGVSNALGAVGYASAIAEMPRRLRLWASVRRPSFTARAAQEHRPSRGLVLRSRSRARAWSGSTSTLNRSGCEPNIISLAKAAADLLETPFNEADVEVVAGHAGPAYGVPHDATVEAIKLAGALESPRARSGPIRAKGSPA